MEKQIIYLDTDDVADLQVLVMREGKENIKVIRLVQTDLGPDDSKLDISFK